MKLNNARIKNLIKLAAISMCAAANAQANVILNPGFEAGLTNYYSPASVDAQAGQQASGNYGLALTGSNAGLRQDLQSRMRPGAVYQLSVTARRGSGAGSAVVFLQFFDSSWKLLSETRLEPTSTSFQRLQSPAFSMPQNTVRARLFLRTSTTFNSVAHFDDVTVSEIPAPATGALKFPRPQLIQPVILELGTGYTSNVLDNTRDYIVKLPKAKKIGGTSLVGGRNIHIIGGHITIPLSANGKGGGHQRALYIKNNVGIVHIEGVLVDGSGGGESDALAIAAPDSIVQVQNFRVNGILGKNSTWHADIIQPWGGVRELRVHNLTGSSHYQGMQLPIDLAPIGKTILSNVNMSSLGEQTRDSGGQLLWVAHNCKGYPMELNEVYVRPRPVRSLAHALWPSSNDGQCPVRIDNGTAYWPNLPVKGMVKQGSPAKDFVPEGTAGINYKPAQ